MKTEGLDGARTIQSICDAVDRICGRIKNYYHPTPYAHQAEVESGERVWSGATEESLYPVVCQGGHPGCWYCNRLRMDQEIVQEILYSAERRVRCGQLVEAVEEINEAIAILQPWCAGEIDLFGLISSVKEIEVLMCAMGHRVHGNSEVTSLFAQWFLEAQKRTELENLGLDILNYETAVSYATEGWSVAISAAKKVYLHIRVATFSKEQ